MLVILQRNTLNLVGRVAIVTSASSHIGAAICRVLLRHNALVLGVDSIPIHKSLNAGAGTHFQFLQYEGDEIDFEKKISEVSRVKFGLEKVDLLVSLEGRSDDNEHGHEEMGFQQVRLIEEFVGLMRESGGGIILNVIGEWTMQVGCQREGDGTAGIHLVEATKNIAKRYGETGVRSNVVRLDATSTAEYKPLSAPENNSEAQALIVNFRALREGEVDERERTRGIADLVLFLSSNLSKSINGAAISVDGGWKVL